MRKSISGFFPGSMDGDYKSDHFFDLNSINKNVEDNNLLSNSKKVSIEISNVSK